MKKLKQKKILAKSRWYYILLQGVIDLLSKFPAITTFLIVLAVIVVSDRLFDIYLFKKYTAFIKMAIGISLEKPGAVDMGFAPEVWLALIGLVLGTLILVISIASQSTPKLIDLYLRDWGSLLFIWFLILSAGHALTVIIFGDKISNYPSVIFNLNFLLLIGIIFAFPYAMYILSYTKPNNVIKKISLINLRLIRLITRRRISGYLQNPLVVEDYQSQLFSSLNQMDDLLAYVSFKEPKAQIIQKIGESIRFYNKFKSRINPTFFKLSRAAKSDISFQTMEDQFAHIEQTQTLYEQKGFRLLGTAYVNMLAKREYDLASFCGAEISNAAETALESHDDSLIELITIQFNTFLRFAIKDGLKNNEGRNLYNLIFHYSTFVLAMIKHNRKDLIEKIFSYLRIYGAEIYNHSRKCPALSFIVDAFAAEMKKALILVCDNNWDIDLQKKLLGELLELDQPPEFDVETLDPMESVRSGVRILQMALALYYLKKGMNDFVDLIINDVMDDRKVLGDDLFQRVMDKAYARLKFAGPTFWEDTDRGNTNIYYTSHGDLVDTLSDMLKKKTES